MCLITVKDVIMAHGRQKMISTSVDGSAPSVVRDGLEGTVSVSVLFWHRFQFHFAYDHAVIFLENKIVCRCVFMLLFYFQSVEKRYGGLKVM